MLDSLFWRRYFEVYDVLNYLRPYQSLMKTLHEKVDPKPGESIVDLGGGTGNLSVLLAQETNAKIYCIDMSEEGLILCSKKNERILIKQVDITKPLPFPDASIDTIVSNNVLYSIEKKNRKPIMKELYRVVKPGGKVVVSNLVLRFKPWRIYTSHIREDLQERGLGATLVAIIKFLPSTLRIFYYNALIKREHASGSYDFFELGEQQDELRTSGFIPGEATLVYAAQAELVVARKP